MNKSNPGAVEALAELLRFYKESGVMELDAEAAVPAAEPARKDLQEDYRDLCRDILNCRKCRLARSRTQAVPGEGSLKADLMFVGEGPGRDEDLQGRPFVGEAGKLLTRIIDKMEFSRKEVYITNVVKCRPPENRNPQADEMDQCRNYLFHQIEMIQPKVIVTLGNVPTKYLLQTNKGITSLRGSWQKFRNIPVMPTFHPSFLIRRRDDKKLKWDVWDDMQKVMAFLGEK
jgi:uracil-DNA glycosylase